MRGTRPLLSVFAHCKPDKNGCWIWQLAVHSRYGYGQAAIGNGKTRRAHRQAWIERNGAIPDGMQVCHRCDVRACINPDHLFLGTAKQNTADMIAKGRNARGETSPWSKLTSEQAREIKTSGESAKALAERFGVRVRQIFRIRAGERWAHI